MIILISTLLGRLITVTGTKVVTNCLPPNIKYPLKCLVLAGQLGVSIGSGGAPISISLVLSSANYILED
jgi:hypothetical protein